MPDRPGPTVFVLFGATGDLAKRMVLPAFYRLATEGLLPKDWLLVGNGRGDVSHLDFRDYVRGVLTAAGESVDGAWSDFSDRLRFAGGGFDTSDPGSLLEVVDEARDKVGSDAQLVHYLAVPPVAFPGTTGACQSARRPSGRFRITLPESVLRRLAHALALWSVLLTASMVTLVAVSCTRMPTGVSQPPPITK